MRHLLESDLAAEVKEGMHECVARRNGVVVHWHGGMRTRREVIVKGRRGKGGEEGKFLKM